MDQDSDAGAVQDRGRRPAVNMGRFALLLSCVCLAAWILPDFAEARRGGGGGRSFSRGGGGHSFSRGGGGSFRSIRNSPRPSQGAISRPSQGAISRPSQGSVARPSQGTVSRPSQGQLPDRLPRQIPAQGGKGGLSSEQKQSVQNFLLQPQIF